MQVVIKIPKDMDGDDCYSRREEYAMNQEKKAQKVKEKAAEKAKKIAKDEARREAKKAEKAEKGT